jgi:hypothetical protein
MASSRAKKTKAKKIKKVKKVKKVKVAEVVNTDIKKGIIEKLLNEKRAEIQKKFELVKKVKTSLQVESKKISELEGAILILHQILTGEKID